MPPESAKWTRRKVVYPFYYSTKGKIVHITAEIRDEPKSLAKLLEALGGRVNFVGTTTYATDDGKAVFSGIGRLRSASDSAESLRRGPKLKGAATWLDVVEGKEGLLVDRYHTGFQGGGGEPYLMLPTAVLSNTFDAMTRDMGSGGETLLLRQGESYAKARWAGLKAVFGPHPEKRLDDVAALVAAIGWAVVTIRRTPGGRSLEFVNHECFECSGLVKSGRGCPFLRGMAVGLAEAVLGVEIVSDETKCRKRGDDACVFVLKARDGEQFV